MIDRYRDLIDGHLHIFTPLATVGNYFPYLMISTLLIYHTELDMLLPSFRLTSGVFFWHTHWWGCNSNQTIFFQLFTPPFIYKSIVQNIEILSLEQCCGKPISEVMPVMIGMPTWQQMTDWWLLRRIMEDRFSLSESVDGHIYECRTLVDSRYIATW